MFGSTWRPGAAMIRTVALAVLFAVAWGSAGCTSPSTSPTPPPASASGSAAVPTGGASSAVPPPTAASAGVDALRRFGVRLPGCRATNVKYSVTDALYLRFDAEQACVGEYLRDLGIADVSDPQSVRPTARGAGCPAPDWCLDASRSYDYYSVFSTPTVVVELYVDTARSPEAVYLRAAARS